MRSPVKCTLSAWIRRRMGLAVIPAVLFCEERVLDVWWRDRALQDAYRHEPIEQVITFVNLARDSGHQEGNGKTCFVDEHRANAFERLSLLRGLVSDYVSPLTMSTSPSSPPAETSELPDKLISMSYWCYKCYQSNRRYLPHAMYNMSS